MIKGKHTPISAGSGEVRSELIAHCKKWEMEMAI